MKNVLAILTTLFVLKGIAQDTTEIYVSPTGHKKILVKSKSDTLLLGLSPIGKVESKTKANPSNSYYISERYYSNGKKMWEISYFGLIQDGATIFYNKDGKKLITIHYAKGIPVDTISHSSKQTIIFGNYSHSSIVYGGMENEDGSSNISEVAGPGMFQTLKLVTYPTIQTSKPFGIQKVSTDFEGNFMLVVPRKKQQFGLFPDNYPTKNITYGMTSPPSAMTLSGSNAWNISQELKTDLSTSFIQTYLRSNSVGYAP